MNNYSIFKLGLLVFEDKDKFKRWLSKTNMILDYKKPIDLLKTDKGKLQVVNCLWKIEYGDYA